MWNSTIIEDWFLDDTQVGMYDWVKPLDRTNKLENGEYKTQ